jgi:hypothetical protein
MDQINTATEDAGQKDPLVAAIPLPRTDTGELQRTFPAGGSTYRWLSLDEIAVRRATHLANWLRLLATGQDSREKMAEFVNETTRQAFQAENLMEVQKLIAIRNQAFLDNIIVLTQEKHLTAMLICACFTLREGEDVRTFSEEIAQGYVRDFEREGYNHLDFFQLAGGLSSDFSADFRRTRETVNQREVWRDDTATKSDGTANLFA